MGTIHLSAALAALDVLRMGRGGVRGEGNPARSGPFLGLIGVSTIKPFGYATAPQLLYCTGAPSPYVVDGS